MFKFSNFLIFPGSQLLSDFQTFLAGNQLYELKRNRRGWCPKKYIAIFDYKQRLLSIDMKTKVVQHVPNFKEADAEQLAQHIVCDVTTPPKSKYFNWLIDLNINRFVYTTTIYFTKPS